MAMYPCDVDNRRYAGAQQTIYPALVDGTSSSRRKLRLCAWHFDALVDKLEKNAKTDQVEFGAPSLLMCLICAKEVTDSEHQFFATVYAYKQDRRDFWAPVHESCAGAVVEDWQLPV
jgi:hypothetical protein